VIGQVGGATSKAAADPSSPRRQLSDRQEVIRREVIRQEVIRQEVMEQ
jgi:hypothetical protein